MSRLTEKQEMGNYVCINGEFHNIGEHINKLGQYEDIDEEVGIDWFTLFKASKKIVIKNDDGSLEEIEHYVEDGWGLINYVFDLDSKVIMFTSYGYELNSLILEFKDYGKTWALTKEELENKEKKDK